MALAVKASDLPAANVDCTGGCAAGQHGLEAMSAGFGGGRSVYCSVCDRSSEPLRENLAGGSVSPPSVTKATTRLPWWSAPSIFSLNLADILCLAQLGLYLVSSYQA